MSGVQHWPVCAGCGQMWPCPEGRQERDEAFTLIAIHAGDYVVRHENGLTFVQTEDGKYCLPIDDPKARAALEAAGWEFTKNGMRRGAAR